MVNTRQHNVDGESKDMPGKNAEDRESDSSFKPLEKPNAENESDNESDLEPLVARAGSSRTNWRSSRMRSRYSSRYRTIERSQMPMRACRLRIVARDTDEMDDSDLQYNDDEVLYSSVKPRREFRRITRRISRSARPPVEDPHGEEQENGMKTEDHEEEDMELEGDVEESGIRRSKRQKKLVYGSFNQSWILGTRPSIRGYPEMYDRGGEGDDNTSNSNDVKPKKEMPEENEKPDDSVGNNMVAGDEEEELYSKDKRTRRGRIRYSPEVEVRNRLRPRLSRRVVAGSDTESESGGSLDDDGRRRRRSERRVYHLRQNKPIVDRFQIAEPTRRSSRLVLCSVTRRPYRNERKRRNSSSSDEERFQRKKAISMAKARGRCMPLNYQKTESPSLQKTANHSSKPMATGSGPKGPADVDPMTIDTSVTFAKVGGLENHLRCLKEMVVFPMLYKEVFQQYNVQPPKGILFHGPPGTGKTLIARALANECSQGERKVAFFMRKGADCLSKWVGESERQLRLLFEQAHQMRPSIIFFDEIDGLAPVRSSKQDQIHASIVSTLLALLDGLDDRGDIIVIGATNRIDAIDPALRRPGRFDRELFFPLPGKKEREEILKIHTSPWTRQPTAELVADIAARSTGYCGADLRLLCSEAVIGAMRRRYPQVYRSSQKLLLNPEQVQVIDEDFREAYKKIVPASCRVTSCPRARLSSLLAPLLSRQLDNALLVLKKVFPPAAVTSIHDRITCRVYKPRMLLYGSNGTYGQTSHLAPALLDVMEHVPIHVLGLDTLLNTTNRSPEEAVLQIIGEATRNPPSVVYMPAIDEWWDLLPPTTHRILIDRIGQISSDSSVLLFGTLHAQMKDSESAIRSLFEYDSIEIVAPTAEERGEFWRNVLMNEPLVPPPPGPVPEEEWEELPVAPAPSTPEPNAQQLEELHNAEEHRLRGLRLFLRDICAKLARNRQFFIFTKPVDKNEVPDYLTIIKKPMDLETMMNNIDMHLYNCAQEFLADIDLIVANALEYNPARDSEDKMIRHKAYMLRDAAYTLIKAEMDTDFEEECRKISSRRREQKAKDGSKEQPSDGQPQEGGSSVICNGVKETPEIKMNLMKSGQVTLSSERARRKKSSWAKGMLHKRKPKPKTENETDVKSDSALPSSQESNSVNNDGSSLKHRDVSPIEREAKKLRTSGGMSEAATSPAKESPPTAQEVTPKKRARKNSAKLSFNGRVLIDERQLEELHQLVTALTEGWTVGPLLDCCSRLQRVIDNYRDVNDRIQLPADLEAEARLFVEYVNKST